MGKCDIKLQWIDVYGYQGGGGGEGGITHAKDGDFNLLRPLHLSLQK